MHSIAGDLILQQGNPSCQKFFIFFISFLKIYNINNIGNHRASYLAYCNFLKYDLS